MSAKAQDLPPEGGYSKINYHRIPARRYFKGWQLISGFLAFNTATLYFYYQRFLGDKCREIEDRSGVLAIQPLLEAESDRILLKTLRINRDEEEKLMANVEGWEIGKLRNKPIFKTVGPDDWMGYHPVDYFAHSDPDEFQRKFYFHRYHI